MKLTQLLNEFARSKDPYIALDIIRRQSKMIEVMRETLDKYTSNPENWEKSVDEWFAVPAQKALAEVSRIDEEN